MLTQARLNMALLSTAGHQPSPRQGTHATRSRAVKVATEFEVHVVVDEKVEAEVEVKVEVELEVNR